MKTYQVKVTQVLQGQAKDLYSVIRDYEVGHAAILPKPTFVRMDVLKGGQGAGTEIQLEMLAFGQTRLMRQIVSEPEPGRVLVEADIETGLATTFTIEPTDKANQTRVTFATDLEQKAGLVGLMEKLVTQMFLPRLYRQEMQNLEAYVRDHQPIKIAS